MNSYLVEDDPLTLIDAGPNTGTALDALERGLHERGYRLEDLQRIVITHQHMDHIGLVQLVADRADAEVLGFAHTQASRLATKPVTALRETKRLLRSGTQAALLARIEDEGAVFTRLLGEPEARAALSAFLARP